MIYPTRQVIVLPSKENDYMRYLAVVAAFLSAFIINFSETKAEDANKNGNKILQIVPPPEKPQKPTSSTDVTKPEVAIEQVITSHSTKNGNKAKAHAASSNSVKKPSSKKVIKKKPEKHRIKKATKIQKPYRSRIDEKPPEYKKRSVVEKIKEEKKKKLEENLEKQEKKDIFAPNNQ